MILSARVDPLSPDPTPLMQPAHLLSILLLVRRCALATRASEHTLFGSVVSIRLARFDEHYVPILELSGHPEHQRNVVRDRSASMLIDASRVSPGERNVWITLVGKVAPLNGRRAVARLNIERVKVALPHATQWMRVS